MKSNALLDMLNTPENQKELARRKLTINDREAAAILARTREARKSRAKEILNITDSEAEDEKFEESEAEHSDEVEIVESEEAENTEESDSETDKDLVIGSQFLTAQRYVTDTWSNKAYAVFFALHPEFSNGDIRFAARVFGYVPRPFEGWIYKKHMRPKWSGFIDSITIGDVVNRLPAGLQAAYCDLDPSLKLDTDNVFYTDIKGVRRQLVFDNKHRAVEKDNRRYSKKPKFGSGPIYVSKNVKALGSGRNHKYPLVMEYLNATIERRWDSGDPISRIELNESIKKHVDDSRHEFPDF